MSVVPAAVRFPRSAGGRRVLLTGLFLGGLLALAFLFGGSAQAAALPGGDPLVDAGRAGKAVSADSARQDSRTGDAARTAHRAVQDQRREAQQQRAESRTEFAAHHQVSRRASGEAVGKVTEPVADRAQGAQRLTRPVGETVDGVADAAQLDRVTGRILPDSDAGRADGTSESRDGRQAQHGTFAAHPAGDSAYGTDRQAQRTLALSAAGLPDSASAAHAEADGTHRGSDGQVPGQRLPLGNAPCVPASTSSSAQHAGDGHGGSRGGADQLAAYLTDGERCALPLPGAVQAAYGTPTRDRAAEILEFPG